MPNYHSHDAQNKHNIEPRNKHKYLPTYLLVKLSNVAKLKIVQIISKQIAIPDNFKYLFGVCPS